MCRDHERSLSRGHVGSSVGGPSRAASEALLDRVGGPQGLRGHGCVCVCYCGGGWGEGEGKMGRVRRMVVKGRQEDGEMKEK